MNYKLSYLEWKRIGEYAGWSKLAHLAPNNNSGMPPDVYELLLHITNEASLYRSIINPTIKNMAKKINKGIFNTQLALKQFNRIAKQGIKDYMQKHGKFNVDSLTVNILAENLLDHYREEISDEALSQKK